MSRMIYGGKGPPATVELRLWAAKAGVRGANKTGSYGPESALLPPLYRPMRLGNHTGLRSKAAPGRF